MEPIFLRIDDVMTMTLLFLFTIYRMVNDGDSPRQIAMGARQVCWHRQEIIDWFDEKLAHSHY